MFGTVLCFLLFDQDWNVWAQVFQEDWVLKSDTCLLFCGLVENLQLYQFLNRFQIIQAELLIAFLIFRLG